MTELETPIPERAEETTEGETGEATIATTKLQLAQTYLNFLDKQKGGILATSEGLGVNFNPLQKDAIDYLTTEKPIKDKGIFDKISKNIKKKFIERLSGGTFLEYDKASLNKMKALIIQYKDDQTKLQELMVQIQEGTDPTLVQEDTKKSPEEQVVPVMVPEIVAEGNELPKPYLFPMPGNIVTSVKGPRWGKEHEGIDIGGTEKEIKSIANGSVEAVGFGSEKAGFNGYGNYVVVKLDTGDRVLYGHLEKLPSLKVDDLIQAGDIIGIMGDTGHSTGLHLHLEIRKGDKNDVTNFFSREVIDPLTVISVTKDMVSPAVLAHMNKTLLDEDSSAIA